MYRLACIALAMTLTACGAPADEAAESDPASELATPPDTFRAGGEASYAGEWAASSEHCGNQREVWTIEQRRLGMKRERFCVFERIFASTDGGLGWSASAKCLANGRQSTDFLFFRLTPSQAQMRVTINDADSVDLVRCPMRT